MAKKVLELLKGMARKARMEEKRETPKGRGKVKKVMEEYEEGELHSGSKQGPRVTNPKQAVAIALSEQREADKRK